MQYGKLIGGRLVRWVAPVVEQPAPSVVGDQPTPEPIPEPIPQPQPTSDYLPIVDESFPPAGVSQGVWVERDGQIVREWVRGPFAISKRALHMAIAAAGKDAEYHAYLAATPGAQDAWDDATVLMSNDPMIVAALPVLSAMLPEGADVQAFLRTCEVAQ